MNLWVVVPAAGIGRRFGGAVPKQYQAVAGQPVIAHSLARLLALDPAALVVVLHRDDPHWPALAVARDPRVIAVSGGEERADSVRAGVVSLAGRAAAGADLDPAVFKTTVPTAAAQVGRIVRRC